VFPGQYQLTLSIEGREARTRAVAVVGDLLSPVTDADRKLWHDASLAVHQLQGIAGEAARRVGALSARLWDAKARLGQNPAATLKTSVDALDRRLATLRRQFAVPAPGEAPISGRGGGGGGAGGVQPLPNQLGGVKGQLAASTSRPTEVQMRLAREAREDLATAVTEINSIITAAMPELYRALGQPQSQPGLTPMQPVAVRVP